MRFEDLSDVERGRVNATIRDFVVTGTKRGLEIIDETNERRRSEGRRELTNGQLAGLVRWPTRLEPGPYSSPAGETIRGRGSALYLLERCQVGYLDSYAQWTAKARAIDELVKHGLNELEAERELYRWFHVSFGVAAVVRGMQTGMKNVILVGARSMEVGSNQGRLSTPAGFVKPTETLSQGFARELGEEALGLELDAKEVESSLRQHAVWTFGPHNTAPSLTFCATALTTVSHADLANPTHTVRANKEWLGEVLVWVTEDAVRAALNGDLTAVQRAFASREIDVKEGFAADVAGPIAEQLDAWRERNQPAALSWAKPLVIK